MPVQTVAIECYNPPPDGIQCLGWQSRVVSKVYPISNCTLTVSYSFRQCQDIACPDKTIFQYALGSIYIPDNCTNIMTQLYPGWPDNFGGTINQSFFNYLVDVIFLTEGKEDFLQNNPNDCSGTPPNCDLPSDNCQTFEIYYSNPRCLAYCLIIGPVLPQGYRETSTTPLYCDSPTQTACCMHRRLFCLCDNDILVTSIDTYTEGDCNAVNEPDAQCPQMPPPYIRYYIPCSSNCNEE